MTLSEECIGRRGEHVAEVSATMSADAYGNTGLHVLATPALIGLVERAAMDGLRGLLADGEMSVGSSVDVTHLAPTPLGATVAVTATITGVERRRVEFEVEASDGGAVILRGRHGRFVVDEARFRAKLDAGGSR